MCGIMGLISASDSSTGSPEDFSKMFQSLAHRGPDAHTECSVKSGRWQARLGHHRLAIIDVAGGQQPMASGSHTIVFNGEIYNFESLRAAGGGGVSWRTRSDTEVVLEALRARGVNALRDFDGFFSFGCWNSEKRELILARDRWGIKPLYYGVRPDGGVLFASELHPFLKSRQFQPAVPIASVRDYLFWDAVPYDRTMLKGVFKLEPGHYLRWCDGEIECRPFFDHRELLQLPRRRVDPTEVWEQVVTAVRDAMISDVPVGLLLSGGIDSSLLAVAAREVQGRPLATFSIGFDEAEFDESAYAREVAGLIGSEHFEHRIGAGEMLDRWEGIVTALDEPLADPSLIPTRILCELARRHVPVVLGGDGGDELFGGYPTYRAQRLRRVLDLIPSPVFEGLRGLIRDRLPMGDGYQPLTWKLKRLIGRYDHEPLTGHLRWMSGTDLPDIQRLGGDLPHVRQMAGVDAGDTQSFLFMDLLHYLPYSVLTKVDRASMAVGLECRPPLLSNRMVERAFTIPPRQKVSAHQTKLILRDAARPRLPAAIVERSKRGFAIPLGAWLKEPLAPEVERMLGESPLWPGLNISAARDLWSQFREGRGDFAKTFWSLLVLHKWMVRHGLKMESN